MPLIAPRLVPSMPFVCNNITNHDKPLCKFMRLVCTHIYSHIKKVCRNINIICHNCLFPKIFMVNFCFLLTPPYFLSISLSLLNLIQCLWLIKRGNAPICSANCLPCRLHSPFVFFVFPANQNFTKHKPFINHFGIIFLDIFLPAFAYNKYKDCHFSNILSPTPSVEPLSFILYYFKNKKFITSSVNLNQIHF